MCYWNSSKPPAACVAQLNMSDIQTIFIKMWIFTIWLLFLRHNFIVFTFCIVLLRSLLIFCIYFRVLSLPLISLPQFSIVIKLRWVLFITYIIIQSITSSEICSLHLTHPSAHTHLEQWVADAAAPGEQLGVRCLAQGFHLSRGQFLPEPRFEPTTSGYKSDALSIRSTTAY